MIKYFQFHGLIYNINNSKDRIDSALKFQVPISSANLMIHSKKWNIHDIINFWKNLIINNVIKLT